LRKQLFIVLVILIVDQVSKYLVKTGMYLGQEIPVIGSWFILHFTENEGMAFGMKFGGEFGKLTLSIFRIIAIAGIGWYLHHLVRTRQRPGLILSVTLIFSGALGNMIDSAFYGLVFSDSYARIAEFMPEGGGYATFLHGKVVDMFYFPLITTTLPDWLPFWGGREFLFFRPVFNVADASISVGVFWLILFQRRYFARDIREIQHREEDRETVATESTDAPENKE